MLGVLQIDLNARVLAVLLILEVLVVALFDFAIVADPGPQGLTTVAFDPSVAFGTAVGATLTFCVASFVGFESAAIYSEECRDPKRTVARATFIAVGLIAVFYALSSWLLGVAAGPDTMVSPDKLVAAGFATDGGPDSTTYLVTSAPIVHVLPVPALASSSTVPVGSGSVIAKGLGSVSDTHSGPTFSTPDSSGSQTCQAYVGRPASRSDSTVARGPNTLTW